MIHYIFPTQNHITIVNTRKTKNKKATQKQIRTSIQLESTNKTHWKLHIDSHKTQKLVKMKKTKMKTPFFHF